MTPEQRHQLKIEAHKADEDIYFLPFDEIKPALEAQRTTMLFLGAIWCHNTQRFTPKYLQVQQWVEQERLFEKGFRMAKVECAVDKEKFCVEEFKIDGFPTILVFVDGKLLHEYPYEDESEPVYNYIKKLVADNPPDPSKVYPDWGSETIAGSPILNNIPVDSSVVNSAHKVLDEHHHAEEAIDAVPVQSSNLYEVLNFLNSRNQILFLYF